MKPEFATAVDPIFTYVLRVVERISEEAATEPVRERDMICNLFREAEAKLGRRPDWELAKYALVCWIDELLTDMPWTQQTRNWWENNCLEFEYFKTRERATRFFVQAKQAAALTSRDALEVFYLGAVLGFRGSYRNPESAPFLAKDFDLPPTLESWVQQTSASIELGQGRPPLDQQRRNLSGAPPLEGKFLFVGMSILGVILAVVVAMLCCFLFLFPVT